MGKKETIDMMVEGGAAKADAAMSQKLGPMKINIQEVLSKVNEKTAHFKGMKIPVKVIVDVDTKDVELEVGTPPTTELIKKELNLQKGSGKPDKEKVGNIAIEQLIKIAAMKEDSLLEGTLKARVKSIAGSANSLGVLVEGKPSGEFTKDLEEGKYANELENNVTEVSKEKQDKLKEQLGTMQEQLKKEAEKLEAAKVAEKPKEEEKKEGEAAEGEKKEEEKKEEKKPEEKKK